MIETKSQSIGKGYSFYFPIAIVIIVIMLILYIVLSIVYRLMWEGFTKTALVWILFLPEVAIGCFVMMFAFLLKGDDDAKTKRRGIAISEVCNNINNAHLAKSDVKVRCGDYSAWLEISYDPKNSKYI